MTSVDHLHDLELLKQAASQAAEIALSYFNKSDLDQWKKNNHSPVSEADMAVDSYLKQSLLGARPDYGWISEETEDNLARKKKQRVFIVDPIDGTRGFIAGNDEWTISLALIESGEPVAAVLINPCRNEMLSAAKNQGAYLNDNALAVSENDHLQGNSVRYYGPMDSFSVLKEKIGTLTNEGKMSSLAYRMAQICMGNAELALAYAGSHEWDIAAIDLILHESGTVLLEYPPGEKLKYNKDDLRNNALIAAKSRDLLNMALSG